MAVSPAGRLVASLAYAPFPERGDTCEVKVWDSQTDKEVVSFTRPAATELGSLAFSPDGQRLALGGKGGLELCATATGQSLLLIDTPAENLAWSPDGQRLATADGTALEEVRVWDAGGAALFRLRVPEHRPPAGGSISTCQRRLAFSPDGRLLATASENNDSEVHAEGAVTLWDLTTGQEVVTLRGHAGAVNAVAFSPDGRRLISASNDHTVRVWDPTTGQEVLTLRRHTRPVMNVAFSSDGHRIVSTDGMETWIWDGTPMPVPAGGE
jgi:WD40 repeat protein